MKLNLGAWYDQKVGWVNHDISELPGIDVIHDLNIVPWPWISGTVNEIKALDLLEHLDDFIKSMEEIYRITSPGALIQIRVPYMGSWSFFSDPTHKRSFHETTFMHFDPSSKYCIDRNYYTNARFSIEEIGFICAPFIPYFTLPGVGRVKVRRRASKLLLGFVNCFLIKNLIQDLEIVLKRA